jgi:hypothetical protein
MASLLKVDQEVKLKVAASVQAFLPLASNPLLSLTGSPLPMASLSPWGHQL